MSVAQIVAPLVEAALGKDCPIRVRCWDGSFLGPVDSPVQVKINSRRALRRLLWAPNELGFSRAYVSGDIEIDGDLFAGLELLEGSGAPTDGPGAPADGPGAPADGPGAPTDGPGVTIDSATRKAIARAAIRLGVLGLPPRPPAEEARLSGGRHTRGRDASAIAHHYDVGNEFYELVLGESMTYSCAYFQTPTDAGGSLADAQFAKCDLVARKLGVTEGMRVLDVGCGWGTFALHVARTYGASVVGVTLSGEQAGYATKRMAQAGVADLVEIRVQDYRDVDDGPFDAISSIGMAEHVGADQLAVYSADLYGLLRPEGRLLNHAISRRPGPRPVYSRTSFLDRYVFPDGELQPMATMIDTLESTGFEVRDVESLREHYALTLRAWVANLEANWDAAVAASTPARARIWRLYMAGSALAFEANRIGVNQVLAVKPSTRGVSGMPNTRRDLLLPT